MADVIAIRIDEPFVNEGSAVVAQVAFRTRSTAAASTPSSVRYRVDCLTTKRAVVEWTSASAASSATITIPGTSNGIVSDGDNFEERQLTVEIDTDLSTQARASKTWKVRNIRTFDGLFEWPPGLPRLEPYFPITNAETSAGVTPTSYQYPPGDSRRYGTVYDGTTDDRGALVNGDAAGPLTIKPGTHAIATSMTFTNRVTFEPGAKIKPASGVVITFTYFPEASPSEWIFDLSEALTGLAIALPPSYDRREVWATWYGAIPGANATKSDNNVELQYAIDSVDTNDQGGGILRLLYGAYFLASGITVKNNIVLRGDTCRTTSLRPSSTAWDGSSTLITFYRTGDASMFNARLEDLSVSGDGNADVTSLIHARAWNEHCGLTRCLIRQFMKTGLRVSDYFGGSATAQLQSVEFFVDTDATDSDQAGIVLEDPAFTQGWHQFLINHVVSCGNSTNGLTKFSGIKADGRVRVINQGGFHVEDAAAVVYLAGDARFEGVGPQATGNATVTDIFSLADDWDTGAGLISCTTPAVGGATGMLINDAGDGAGIGLSRTANPLIYPLEKTYTGTTMAIDHARFRTHYLNTTAGAATVTLGDGHDSKEIFILMTVDNGNATLNASTEGNFATITFDNPGDWVLLRFAVGFGWYVIAGNATVS